jgi:RNA polymerase sigma-70 factor (ECF subfamily)
MPTEDEDLIARIGAGEEQAFVSLVARYNPTLLRLARSFVPSEAVAEEVVQETWVAVLKGLGGFERRSTFRTWLIRILVNRARTTGVREKRAAEQTRSWAAVDPARFDRDGAWSAPPQHWSDQVDDRLRAAELSKHIVAALGGLPDQQREVVILRDIEGLSGKEVCQVLDLSEANQRVLLHRGRSQLRQVLESAFGEG